MDIDGLVRNLIPETRDTKEQKGREITESDRDFVRSWLKQRHAQVWADDAAFWRAHANQPPTG
jgi:hypothetical protein